MIRDSEKGLGYLVGHEEPETKARRVAEIKRQIESSLRPLSDPTDVFSSLPLATEVNLGNSNSLAHPKITSPVKPKWTDKEIVKFALEENPEPINKTKKNKWKGKNAFDYYDSPEGIDFITSNMDGISKEEADKMNKEMKASLRITGQLTALKKWDKENKERKLRKNNSANNKKRGV